MLADGGEDYDAYSPEKGVGTHWLFSHGDSNNPSSERKEDRQPLVVPVRFVDSRL